VLLSGFEKLETKYVGQSLNQVKNAINTKVDELSTKLVDWSQWDDSYTFIKDHNKKFITSNLTNSTFSGLKINVIVFVDTSGKIVYSKFINLETMQEQPLPPELVRYLSIDSPLFRLPQASSVVKGLMYLPQNNLIFAVRPITTSEGTGSIRGALLFGKVFDNTVQQDINSLTRVDTKFYNLNTGNIPNGLNTINNYLLTHNSIYVEPKDDETVAGYSIINDFENKPLYMLRITEPRAIIAQGKASIIYFLSIYGFVFFVFTIVILLLLDRIVIKKLQNLTNNVIKMRSDKNTSERIMINGNDELATLAHEINSMLDSVEESSQKVKQDEIQIEAEARELEHKNTTLEKSTETLLNVMGDLESTKSKIEHEKILDEIMLKSIGEGLIVTDHDGVITIANKSSQEMFGWDGDELIGKPINVWIPMQTENRDALSPQDTVISKVLKNGLRETATYYFTRKDGSEFPAIITSTAVVVDDKITGAISVIHDVTKEKEVDRMKTEFISLASHQLRTPLVATKWISEILQEESQGLNPEIKQYITSIHEANEHMIDLVDALLNISRIESGRIIIDPKPTSLPDLVKSVISEVAVMSKEKDIQISVSSEENLPTIQLDPKLMRHVYMNLLTNSIKYSPDHSHITVSLYRKDTDIISEVKDEGYGIPKNVTDRVFQKFFRAENIAKKVTEGTGLGLYLVKLIVDAAEGKIWFETEENKGTRFWFSLPINGMSPKKGEVSLS
jgi:PAS domain S-box-containing protein